MNLSGLGQIWLDIFREEPDRIGSGSDLDPNGSLWIWIGSRSNFSSLDRIGSNSKKIGAEYITAEKLTDQQFILVRGCPEMTSLWPY